MALSDKVRSLVRRLSFRPSRVLVASCTSYFLNLIVGPYRYTHDYPGGWYYFALTGIAFWASMNLFERSSVRNQDWPPRFRLRRRAELTLCVAMVVALVAMVVTVVSAVQVTGFGVGANMATARELLDAAGPQLDAAWWLRLARAITAGAPAFGIVLFTASQLSYPVGAYLAIACIFAPGLWNLVQGGRNAAVFATALLVILLLLRVKLGNKPLHGRRLLALGTLGGIAVVAYLSFGLFVWRSGVSTAVDLEVRQMNMYLERVELRESYEWINQRVNGRFSPVYHLSYYYSHSLPFFGALFATSDYGSPAWGRFHFRILDLIVAGSSLPFLKIVKSQVFWGLYPPAVHGVLLDFGPVLTPAVLVLLGLAFGATRKRAWRGSFPAMCFLPLVLIWVFVYPVYYFAWAGSDFVGFALIGILAWLRLTRGYLPQQGTGNAERPPSFRQ